LSLRDRLADPRYADRRPRRAAYALPTFFTAGNIFLGYVAILRSIRAATLASAGLPGVGDNFALAAKFIGAAVFLDGLDGYIARLTNTTSDFGREMDSLADVVSFGLAPAILAFTWGIQQLDMQFAPQLHSFLRDTGAFASFLLLLCGAVRLARFNVQKNPVPTNPGRPDRKYFVGMPIPAGASMVAATVYAFDGEPLRWWPLAVVWMCLLALLGFVMVSTWRYYSFKGLKLHKARSPLFIILLGALIYGVWNYGQILLLVMASTYVASGIVIRVGGIIRRRMHHAAPPPPHPEHQIG
jgi:CDP-diacylglycerol--serine O-phosphatidyltransferase